MKISVVGTRGIKDREYIKNVFEGFINQSGIIPKTIVCGDSSYGVDRTMKDWAKSNNIKILLVKHKWAANSLDTLREQWLRDIKLVSKGDILVSIGESWRIKSLEEIAKLIKRKYYSL